MCKPELELKLRQDLLIEIARIIQKSGCKDQADADM